MIIDLSNFLDDLNDHFSFEGKLKDVESDLKEKGITIVEPIEYEGMIFKLNGEKAIEMKLTFNYEEPCSRCLRQSIQKVETTISGKLVEGKGQEIEIENKEEEINSDENIYDETFYYENYKLNFMEEILNQAVISLPMKSLCDEDCKGLCELCGIDLNKETCQCIHDEIDPRLEKLKNFFPKK